MAKENENEKGEFQVIVPIDKPRKFGRRSTKRVSYPASGCRLYTRQEAIAVMRKMIARWGTGEANRIWAESDKERFTLSERPPHDVEPAWVPLPTD